MVPAGIIEANVEGSLEEGFKYIFRWIPAETVLKTFEEISKFQEFLNQLTENFIMNFWGTSRMNFYWNPKLNYWMILIAISERTFEGILIGIREGAVEESSEAFTEYSNKHLEGSSIEFSSLHRRIRLKFT